MRTADYAIREVERLVTFRDRNRNGLCDAELGNAFLCVVMESELSCVEPCFAFLATSTRKAIHAMLIEFAARDYFDDRHAFILDGRSLEQRRQHYLAMQPHYREIGEKLFALLDES